MHDTYLPWLLEQIREALRMIDNDPALRLRLIDALIELYLKWSEQ